MTWVSTLADVSIWIILVPAAVGLLMIKRLDHDSKLILIVVLLGCIPQVLRPFITDTFLLSAVYNVYTPLEFTAYWILFRRKIVSTGCRNVFNLTGVFFLVLSGFIIYQHGLHVRFLNEWVVWSNICQVIWLGLSLLEYYNTERSLIDVSQPFFWFLLAITCYAPGTAIFFSLWHFIKNNPDQQFEVLNSIHHIFNILLYVFFTIGLSKNAWRLKYQA